MVKACQLTNDLNNLPKGDGTMLGENGVTLSGGQKARLILARTVYANSDVVLLDDPISALDTKVGKAVFNECIRGLLKNKTTIMATHAVDYFRLADKIILMQDGEIEEIGTLDEVKDNEIMAEILKAHEE